MMDGQVVLQLLDDLYRQVQAINKTYIELSKHLTKEILDEHRPLIKKPH